MKKKENINSPHKGEFSSGQVRHNDVSCDRYAGFRMGDNPPVQKTLESIKDNA
jgi:hypothetical protein